MNILILGSGGREHALAHAYSKSKNVRHVFVLPGNGLMDYENEKISIFQNIQVLDFDAVLDTIKREKIDLIDIAQEGPLAAGFVDKFQAMGLMVFGPTQKAAEIEWNKQLARDFMVKYKLPTPQFKTFTDQSTAIAFINKFYDKNLESQKFNDRQDGSNTLYVKASGLAFGKGAIRAETKDQAIEAIKTMSQFGKAGETFLIEECLVGKEFSLFAICDGQGYQIAGWARDHKTVYDKDQGPNTGGMGCIAPTNIVNKQLLSQIDDTIIKPYLLGMQKENRAYTGILYLGGIITRDYQSNAEQIKIIEFNARWGDPEAEVILPSIKSDYLTIAEAALQKRLKEFPIMFDNKIRISIAGCSLGYPNDYSAVNGKEIFGLDKAMKCIGITIYGAGIVRKENRFFANGGRVFHLVAEGDTIIQARDRAYEAMAMIDIEGHNLHFRSDIGVCDMDRSYI